MNRKGDVYQLLFMLVILFVIALVGLITLVLTTRINDFWDSSELLNDTAIGTKAIDDIQDTAPRTTDYAIFFLFIGMNVGVIIAAVRTNFSSLIMIFFIFLTLISIMISAGMVNMYQGFAQQSSIIDVSGNLVLTNFIFSKYLPLIISVISALVMLFMYGKSGQDIIS